MYVGLLLLSTFIFVIVCVYFAHAPSFSFFHPLTIYLAFHGLVFAVRPLLAYYYGYSAIYDLFEFAPDAYAKNMALIVANIGLICFAVTSIHFGNEPFRNKFDAFAAREAAVMMRPLTILFILMLPLIAYSTYLAWGQRSGDFVSSVSDLKTGVTISTSGEGYTQGAQLFAATLVAIFAWVGRFRLWTLIPAALFILIRAGSGGRGAIITTLVCLSCFYLYARRRNFPDWRVLATIALGIVLFNTIGEDRGQSVRALFTNDTTFTGASKRPLAPLESMDTGNLEFLEYLTDKVPRDTGTYEYFVDNLQLITEPVPRTLWKGKPIGQPIRLFNLFDYGFPIGMTRSLPGEGWIQLGLLGVALWCSLWGTLLGWVYNAYVRSRQTVLQTSLYFTLLATLTVFYRDGMLLTLVKQMFFFMSPAVLWHWLAKAMRVPRQPDFRRLAALRLQRLGVTGLDHVPGDATPTLPRSQRGRAASAVLPRG